MDRALDKYCAIAKQSYAFKTLLAEFRSGRGNHAYILESADTLLSKCIAINIACADGCADVCLNCARCRRIISGNSGDVKILGEDGFKVENADDVVSSCLITPNELNYKYFILDMTNAQESAQNKLLKTLEESPNCSIFFLIVPSIAGLLPTVASRCEVIMPTLPDRAIDSLDSGFSLNMSAALYGGRESLTVFDGILTGEKSDAFFAALRMLQELDGSKKFLTVSSLLPTKRDEAMNVLGFLEMIYGDILRASCGLNIDTHGLYDMKAMVEKFPKQGIPDALAAVRKAVKRLPSGNMASIADMLAIALSEVNYNAKSSRR